MIEGFDASAFRDLFLAEARERIARMNQGLLTLEARPEDREAVHGVLREAHSLKAAARMMGFPTMGTLAHRLENLLVALEEKERPLTREEADLVFEVVDALSRMLDGVAQGKPEADVQGLLVQLEAVAPAAEPAPASPERVEWRSPEMVEGSIRVSLEKLDRLANLAVEMAVSRIQAAEARRPLRQAMDLSRAGLKRWADLREALAKLPGGEGAHEAIRQAESWDRDLRHAVQRAWGELEEVHVQQERLAVELRHQILGIRMQPLAVVFDTVPRAVRDLSRHFGKEVGLVITGGEVELDRRIIEALGEPLLHLIRNALDHGIEAPAAREAAGKPARGHLAIQAQAKGNRVVLEIEDDGAGIAPATLRETAVRTGLLKPEAAATLSDAEALDLIFLPGFSTSRLITDVSGRGIGMEVVRKSIERLRGSVAVESALERGTRFILDLPFSLAMLSALFVRSGGVTYAIPAGAVERIVRLQPGELQSLEGRQAMRLEGETIPLVDLGALLGGSSEPRGEAAVNAVLLRAGARRVGFFVDEVLDGAEVVQKDLGAFLRDVEGVAGATVLGTGEVVLILDPSALIRAARGAPAAPRELPKESVQAPARLLLVEDSLIARDLERTILESAGYDVDVALDGIDALERLRTGTYDLIVTDIEMPRMDGFALLERIRTQERTRDLPVVVVTNRERSEDKRRGMELGADAYILKSGFDQSSLLDTIRQLIGSTGRSGG